MTVPLDERPADLLADLIRFDTTNPPGNERACIEFIEGILHEAGLETETYAAEPERPNLLARLPGGDAPPLLLYGHVDVVPASQSSGSSEQAERSEVGPTEGQEWSHPPFEGVVEDGMVWGRGALDMKGGVAMLLSAVLRAVRTGLEPAGDVLFLALSDEEAGGDMGARYMAEEHPEVFEGVRYALGEFGGYTQRIDEGTFYPIQVAEKQVCWLRATFEGAAGHASRARPGEAMTRMANAVARLGEERLPIHITPVVEESVAAMIERLGEDHPVAGLTDPERADAVLATLDDNARKRYEPMLRNTANPTVVSGGSKENVIPGTVTLTLDCRLVPGQTREDVERELRELWDDPDVTFEAIRYEPWEADLDMGLFDLLGDVLHEADPNGTPLPLLLTGATDGRHLASLGIQSYGFTPLQLPPDFPFMQLAHAADERVPVSAVEFGTDAIYRVLERYDG